MKGKSERKAGSNGLSVKSRRRAGDKQGYQFEYRILLKYLCKYLCIVTVFIILMVYIYDAMYTVTKNNTINEETDRVYKSAAILDHKIEAITSITALIQRDANFHRLSERKGELDYPGYFYLLKTQEVLNELRSQYDLDLLAYFVFKNNDAFVSESKVSPEYDSIFTHFLKYEVNDSSELRKEALSSDKNMIFLPSQNILYMNGSTINGITCMIKVPGDYGTAESAIIYTLDMKYLLDNLDIKENGQEFLQITDKMGNVLLNCNYSGEPIRMEGENWQDLTLNGEKYTVIKAKTEYNNFNIVKGIKTTVFENKIESVLRIIKLYIFSAVIASVVISLLLSLKQFGSIRRVLNILGTRPNQAVKTNEFKYIYSSVKDVFDENKKYEEALQSMKDSMRYRMIEKSINQGIYSEKEKEEFVKYVGSKIEFFCLVSVVIKKEEESASEGGQIEDYGKALHYIKNKIDTNIENVISIYCGIDELAGIILLRESDSADCRGICSFMQKMASEVFAVYGQPVEIGISNIGYGINSIHTCYLQAKRAILQFDGQTVLPVSMAAGQYADIDIVEEVNIERQLFDLIITEDKEAIKLLFQRISRHVGRYAFSSEQELMQMFFLVRSPIKNARNRIINDGNEIALPDYNENYSITRLLDGLKEASLKLCDYSLQKRKSDSETLRNAVLNYIYEQYSNPNLCAALLAEVFSISEKYVFRIVKEKTGMSVGKYVEEIRMQKAKELLKETQLSAAEISREVGFNSVTTFYKAFNRVFGVAPIAWRESLEQKQPQNPH